MEMESESGSCDTVHARVHKRTRSASPETGPSESRLIPDAVIQICLEGKGVRWDNGRLCYEVQDPVAFEARYKELLQDKISEWTWNQLDKYYSLWQSSRWSRKGSCFTPRDVLETRFWQRLALAPPALFWAVDTHTHTEQELARVNSLLDAACEHRQEKLGLQKRVKALEQDLAVAKQTCKDQEYHIAQVAAAGGPDFKQEWQALLPAGVVERQEWQVLCAEMTRERERLEARVRELEVLEMSWKQMRGIFNTKGPV
jgi:BMFP domain-containing protein YqiC